MRNHLWSFRCWCLRKRMFQQMKKIKNMKIFQSVFFHMLLILTFCIAFLWILFLCLPKNGFLQVESNNAQAADLQLNQLQADLSGWQIRMESHGYTAFEFNHSNIQYQGRYLFDQSEDFTLIIEGNTLFSLSSADSEAFLETPPDQFEPPLSINVFNQDHSAPSTWSCDSDLSYPNLFVAQQARTYIAFANCQTVILDLGHLTAAQGGTEVSLHIKGESKTIHISSKDVLPPLFIVSDYSVSTTIQNSTALDMMISCESYDVDVDDVTEGNLSCDGSMQFNNTSDSQLIPLANNYVYFKSANPVASPNANQYAEIMSGHLSYSQSDSNLKLTLYGKVSQAYLSGYDIFPSFQGWLYNNLNLIATSLITSVLGGIAMKKMKK